MPSDLELNRVINNIQELLHSASDVSHDRCVKVLTARAKVQERQRDEGQLVCDQFKDDVLSVFDSESYRRLLKICYFIFWSFVSRRREKYKKRLKHLLIIIQQQQKRLRLFI